MLTEKQIKEAVDALSLDELCGQILNYDMCESRMPLDKAEEIISKTLPGSYYMGSQTPEYRDAVLAIHNKYCKTPAIITADIENGPGSNGGLKDAPVLPRPMAWGASDDPELIERASRATAKYCRSEKVSLALAPVVDINMNFTNCLVNTRAVSDSAEQVAKITSAVVKGYQKDGLLGACIKHFPGDGVDQRNQHFMTTVNSLSREEWMNTYGKVYKRLIDEGVMAVMVAHIALPAFDEKIDDYLGYPPATLSYNLMTGLLKGQLGFSGCIVSDAMCMIGSCAMVDIDRMAVEFVKAGGDLMLFALPSDFDRLKEAVESKELSIERVKDAVTRIFRLKNSLGHFDSEEKIAELAAGGEDINTLAQMIADKSISVIRDKDGLIPAKGLKAGSKILIGAVHQFRNRENQDNYNTMQPLADFLTSKGFDVTLKLNPDHYEFKNIEHDYDCVLFCIDVDALSCLGGSLRIHWDQVMPLWRGYIFKNPNLIFASFGDPYKLYDYPFAKTYVNCYSNSPSSQIAFGKVLLGEIKAEGKSPVAFEGYFDRETD